MRGKPPLPGVTAQDRAIESGVVSLSDVYGRNSATNPLSYVVRDVEKQFREALTDGRYEVIVLYGTSKQGKSSLRRSVLPDERCTFAQAGNEKSRESLYRGILDQVGAHGRRAKQSERTRQQSLAVGLNFLKLLGLGSLFGADVSVQRSRSNSTEVEDIEVDFSSADAVARRYKASVGLRPIVIDNFHHVGTDLQRQLATDIRVFGGHGIKIVILGTWRNQNYIQAMNTDLHGRVCTLSIEPWSEADLARVIKAGERHLNLRFSDRTIDQLVRNSIGNVSLLQEITLEYLSLLGITQREQRCREIDDQYHLREACRSVTGDRVHEAIVSFQQLSRIGSTKQDKTPPFYWVVRAFLEDPQAVNTVGIEIGRLLNRASHLWRKAKRSQPFPEDMIIEFLRFSLLTAQDTLFGTAIMAYDENAARLGIIDSWTLFTLRRQRGQILQEL